MFVLHVAGSVMWPVAFHFDIDELFSR